MCYLTKSSSLKSLKKFKFIAMSTPVTCYGAPFHTLCIHAYSKLNFKATQTLTGPLLQHGSVLMLKFPSRCVVVVPLSPYLNYPRLPDPFCQPRLPHSLSSFIFSRTASVSLPLDSFWLLTWALNVTNSKEIFKKMYVLVCSRVTMIH